MRPANAGTELNNRTVCTTSYTATHCKEQTLPMYSTLTVEPITPQEISAINLPGVLISIGIGVAVWLVASFIISGITKRVAEGSTFFKKRHFRWVTPALRALDHERRVQRANTIGALLRSVVGVLVAVLTIMYVLKNLNVDIAPLLTSVGILGVAIGFGAQQLIRDFLAGIFITLEDQYGIGDVIETSEVVGVGRVHEPADHPGPGGRRHHLVPAQRRNPARGQPFPGQLHRALGSAGQTRPTVAPQQKAGE